MLRKSSSSQIAKQAIYLNIDELDFENSLDATQTCKPTPSKLRQQISEPQTASPAIRKFNQFLIEAIDETLLLLGKPIANTFYVDLENVFHINKKDIPNRIEEFSYVFHKSFGSRAGSLESRFKENLRSKISVKSARCNWRLLKRVSTDLPFVDYVKAICDILKKHK